VIGIPVALLRVRFVKAQLYEAIRVDTGILAVAVVTLGVAGFMAGLIPARRASSVNPVDALRME
jgi:ABC-type antimicrobial peptide transport system permease subunit